jgi:hypothetical protein
MTPSLSDFNRPSTWDCHIACISPGGPGKVTMILPSFATHQPGAVPEALLRGIADGMIMACRMLFSGISMPRPAKKAL